MGAAIGPRAHTGVALAHRAVTRIAHVRRYSEIVSVLVKYGFVDVVHALHLTPYLAAGRRVLSALGRAPSRRPDPRSSPAAHVRGARTDLHQIRPGVEHPRRSASPGRGRRAHAPAGCRGMSAAGRRRTGDRSGSGLSSERRLLRLRDDTTRGRLDCPGPSRDAPLRRRRRRESPKARNRGGDRSRPRDPRRPGRAR